MANAERAELLYRQHGSVRDVARTLLQQATYLRALLRSDDIPSRLSEAAELFRASEDHDGSIRTLLEAAQYKLDTGDASSAEKLTQEALSTANERGINIELALSMAGLVHLALGDPAGAIDAHTRAIQARQSGMSTQALAFESWRLSDSAVAAGQWQLALDACTAAARDLLNIHTLGLAPQQRAEVRGVWAPIPARALNCARLLETRDAVETAFAVVESLRARTFAEEVAAGAAPPPLSVSRIQRLLPTGTTLLLFATTEESSTACVIDCETVRLVALAPANEQLRRIDELAWALEDGAAPASAFVAPAYWLGRELVTAVFGSDVPPRLLIVPDGPLVRLPFEALLIGEPGDEGLAQLPYLIRRAAVSYLPSASFLGELARRDESGTEWDKQLLLLGDPAHPAVTRLEHARHEVVALARLQAHADSAALARLDGLGPDSSVEGDQFELRLGAAADAGLIERDLRGFRRLHFAVHGVADGRGEDRSGLYLAPTPTRDGFVSIEELASARIDAELVYLSGCVTNEGRMIAAEGAFSVARAFLVAGARSVISTRTPIADTLAKEMALAVEQEISSGATPSQALRAIVLSWMDGAVGTEPTTLDPRGATGVAGPASEPVSRGHPCRWSCFTVIGR